MTAKSDVALRGQAERLRSHLLAHPELSPVDVGMSLATTRSQFDRRATVLAADRQALLDGLARHWRPVHPAERRCKAGC